MRISKQQSLAGLAIVVFLIGAATWAVNHRASIADDPETKKPGGVATNAPAGERLKTLLRERRDLAEAQFEVWQKGEIQWKESLERTRKAIGPGGTGDRNMIANVEMHQNYYDKARAEVNDWVQRLLAAELDLSENRAARLAAYERHLLRMKKLEGFDKWPDEIAANSKYHRLNAEVLLERAKND